ncbi:hypothetical protein Q2941_06560 [Bradyrhizobium sp. UFLA05-153]
MKPAEHCNAGASKQAECLQAHFQPVLDRSGISMNNPLRQACKTVYNHVQNTSTMRASRDLSLDKARPHCAEAIDAKIDCDDASDDFIKKELHSKIRSPSNRFDDQAVLRVNRQGYRLGAVMSPDLVLVQLQE